MTSKYKRFVTKRELVERIEVVFPCNSKEERNAMSEALYADGFRVLRQGPYTDKEMFPKCDPTRQLFIAEREMEE